MSKTAEIISIGDELLIGQVINTNASWMAQELNLCGISVHQISVVSDAREHILQSLEEAHQRVDIILITGGLGPTKDDITKGVLCEYFETELEFHEPSFHQLESLFAKRGWSMNNLNRQQAYLPASCTAVVNHNGTAPGMWFEKDGKIYISMPGVPFEMKPMMSDFILPELKMRFSADAIYHKTILTQGVGESFLAEKIADWEDQLPRQIKLAYLPQPGIVRLRLTGKSKDYNQIKEQVEAEAEKLRLLIPDLIFGYNQETLEAICGELLLKHSETLGTAESCTGGYIAHRITSVPGSSNWFRGSIIAYANDVKISELGVSSNAIQQQGAVSEPVVRQMAAGLRKKLQTDWAIAISGIAGPDGGSPEKPVGTIWIAISGPGRTIARSFLFGNSRERNIILAANSALNLLRKEILLNTR